MTAAEYARTADITELDIRRAERAADAATVAYSLHEWYCSLWRRDLTCTTCAQLWTLAEEQRRFWESLVAEQARQHPASAERAAEGAVV